jgi:hypothetical protein
MHQETPYAPEVSEKHIRQIRAPSLAAVCGIFDARDCRLMVCQSSRFR